MYISIPWIEFWQTYKNWSQHGVWSGGCKVKQRLCRGKVTILSHKHCICSKILTGENLQWVPSEWRRQNLGDARKGWRWAAILNWLTKPGTVCMWLMTLILLLYLKIFFRISNHLAFLKSSWCWIWPDFVGASALLNWDPRPTLLWYLPFLPCNTELVNAL